jgi:surface-anchored protein
MKIHLVQALLVTFFVTGSLHAQLYTAGHGDLGVVYEGGELAPHWHLDDGAIVDGNPLPINGGNGHEYDPGDMVAGIATAANSASSSTNYLGVATGTPIFVTGPVGVQPNLGFAAEELNPDNWNGNITITLTGWTLPSGGQFALYDTNGSGTTTTDVFFSTLNPGATIASNSFTIPPGFHEHFTFGFTAPGSYQLNLTWSGTHFTDGAKSQSGIIGFQVVPEPSVSALVGLGILTLLQNRSRKRA